MTEEQVEKLKLELKTPSSRAEEIIDEVFRTTKGDVMFQGHKIMCGNQTYRILNSNTTGAGGFHFCSAEVLPKMIIFLDRYARLPDGDESQILRYGKIDNDECPCGVEGCE